MSRGKEGETKKGRGRDGEREERRNREGEGGIEEEGCTHGRINTVCQSKRLSCSSTPVGTCLTRRLLLKCAPHLLVSTHWTR